MIKGYMEGNSGRQRCNINYKDKDRGERGKVGEDWCYKLAKEE